MSNYTVRVTIDDVNTKQGTTVPRAKTKKKAKTGIRIIDVFRTNQALNVTAVAGAVLGTSSVINGTVGNYTEDRIRQRRINRSLTVAGYAVAIAVNPLSAIGIGAIEAKRHIDFRINNEKKDIKSRYLRELSGNTTQSGNRWRGAR